MHIKALALVTDCCAADDLCITAVLAALRYAAAHYALLTSTLDLHLLDSLAL